MSDHWPEEKELPEIVHGKKHCGRCGRWRDYENFDKDCTKADGHRYACKDCRKQELDQKRVNKLMEQCELLDNSGLRMLESMAANPAVSTNLPHVATLMEDTVGAFGGSSGYAQFVMAEFLRAAPGSMVRQRYLTMIQKMVERVSEAGFVQQPLESMDDVTLDEYIAERRRRVQESLGLRITHETDDDADGSQERTA